MHHINILLCVRLLLKVWDHTGCPFCATVIRAGWRCPNRKSVKGPSIPSSMEPDIALDDAVMVKQRREVNLLAISLPITSSLPFTQRIYRPLFLSLVLSSLIHSCAKPLLFPRSLTLPSFRFCLHYCLTPPSHNGRWRKNIGEIYTALGNGKMNDLPKWKRMDKSLTDQWSGLPTHTHTHKSILIPCESLVNSLGPSGPYLPGLWPCRHWVKSWADRALSFYSCPMCIQPRKGKRRGDSSPPLLHTHHTKQSYMQTHRTHMHTI